MKPNCATATMPRPGKPRTAEDLEYARLWRQSIRDHSRLTRFFRSTEVEWDMEGIYTYHSGSDKYKRVNTLEEVERDMKAGRKVVYLELGDLVWQLKD